MGKDTAAAAQGSSMSESRGYRGIIPVVLLSTATAVLAACFRQDPAPLPAAQPVIREIVPEASPQPPVAVASGVTLVEPVEPLITLTMANAPVRVVLERLAEIGNLSLIIPASLTRTVSVQYVNVPVSVALKDLLSRSGLRLGTATSGPLPFDTVTVYYHLPAHIDSLSVEGIMRRFGVSRAMAELIVKSRRP